MPYALQSLLPEGEITDLSQLPGSIPAYLIRVVPELKAQRAGVEKGGGQGRGSRKGGGLQDGNGR